MHENMSAAEAAAAHLILIARDIGAWIELFDERGVIEFPYAGSIGTPARLEGKDAIVTYMKDVPSQMKDLAFTDVRISTTRDPDVVFIECHGSAVIAATGKTYAQDYVMRVETRGGRIVRYREYWNPLPALEAFGGDAALREHFDGGSK